MFSFSFLTGISCFWNRFCQLFLIWKFKSWYSCVQSFEFIRSAKGHQLNIQKHEILQKIWKIACDLGFAATNCSWIFAPGGRSWQLLAAPGVCSIFIFCVRRLQHFYFLRLQYYYFLCLFCSIYDFLILQY